MAQGYTGAHFIDFSKFLLLAGRTGATNDPTINSGGTATGNLYGSSQANGVLVLNSTSNATKGNVRFPDNVRIGSNNAPTATVLHLDAATTAESSLRIDPGTAPSSPNLGDIWHDSGQQCFVFEEGLSTNVIKTFDARTTVSVKTSNSASAQVNGTAFSLWTGGNLAAGAIVGTLTFPANFLNVLGKRVRIRMWGTFTTKAATVGNLQIKVLLGANVVVSTVNQTPVASASNFPWYLECDMHTATTGASGNVTGQGFWDHVDVASATAADIVRWAMTNTAGVTVDLTASQALDVTATFATANLSNSVLTATGSVEVLM